jgi:hypothetical protein
MYFNITTPVCSRAFLEALENHITDLVDYEVLQERENAALERETA